MNTETGVRPTSSVAAKNYSSVFREAQNLTDEIHHLLGSRQTAQVAVNDDAVEAVIDEGQQVSE
jgi:hypothetical protein